MTRRMIVFDEATLERIADVLALAVILLTFAAFWGAVIVWVLRR